MRNFEKDSYSDLLTQVSHGNHQAFSKLYDLFYPALIQHVLIKVRDESDAQDILHDLFLSLWRRREKITEVSSLPAYLYSSCRYLIINYHKKKIMLQSDQDTAELELGDNEISIEERLYYRYILDKVTAEIDRLPEKCRRIFKMSREDYMSNREIADYLQISESTVENQIRTALQRIRKVSNRTIIYLLFPIF